MKILVERYYPYQFYLSTHLATIIVKSILDRYRPDRSVGPIGSDIDFSRKIARLFSHSWLSEYFRVSAVHLTLSAPNFRLHLSFAFFFFFFFL